MLFALCFPSGVAMAVKYVAEIKNVREVCLVGSADFEFWATHLGKMRLSPTSFGGAARVFISVVKLKWMGIAFEELSIAVPIDSPDASTESVYLVSAFSTSRLFAWCERMLFQTPYEHAPITMEAEQPWSFELRDDAVPTISVQCRRVAPVETIEEDLSVSIFLPTANQGFDRKLFYAKLSGSTQVAPFEATGGEFRLRTSVQQPAIQLLVDSRFTPIEWRVRPKATHARSKTFTLSSQAT